MRRRINGEFTAFKDYNAGGTGGGAQRSRFCAVAGTDVPASLLSAVRIVDREVEHPLRPTMTNKQNNAN